MGIIVPNNPGEGRLCLIGLDGDGPIRKHASHRAASSFVT